MVIDVIKKKQTELLEKLNLTNNNISNELLATFESFSNRLLENPDELNQIEVEEYVNEVYKNREDVNRESISKTLNALKSFIDLKQNNAPGLFELNTTQVQLINRFGNDIKEFVNNIKENRKHQEKIREEHNKYNAVLDKMINNTKLSKEDLNIITGLVPEDDKKAKIELLKEVIEHNLNLEKQKRKAKKEPTIEPIKEPLIDIETVIRELQKNESNEKKHKQIEQKANKYKEEIESNYQLNKCQNIINYLKEIKIYNKFNCVEDLIAVLIYGDLDSVKNAYEEYKELELLDKDFIYKFPGLWTKQEKIKKSNTTTNTNKNSSDKNNSNDNEDDQDLESKSIDDCATLLDKVSLLDRESFFRKLQLYKDNNIDPFENEKKCTTLFLRSEETIKRNVEIYKVYNIKPNALIMGVGSVSKRCDQLIECNLLNPNLDIEKSPTYPMEEKRQAYINILPSFIGSFQPGHVFIIADLLEQGKEINKENQSEILDSIYTKRNFDDDNPRLATKFSEHFFGYDIKKRKAKNDNYEERWNNFLKFKELVTVNKDLLKDYDEMIEKTKNYERVEYKQETIDSPFIKALDKAYMKEDYYYEMEGRRISRRKVLRLYEALQEYNKSHPEEAFAQEDIELFAVTYGTYFRLETLYSIITMVQELKRGENTNEISNRL